MSDTDKYVYKPSKDQHYLDSAANTPIGKVAFKAMKPYLTHGFVGNTAAIHDFGIKAAMALEGARRDISLVLGCDQDDVIFTSGATEGNNMVLRSMATLKGPAGGKPHFVVSSVEHSSVYATVQDLEKQGLIDVTYVKPGHDGRTTMYSVKKAINDNTVLVCVMSVNNETGVANDVESIGAMAHRHGISMMSDCTQQMSLGGASIRLRKKFPSVDYFTFSAHKFYGPTGVGCLIVNQKGTCPKLRPLITGGSQEYSRRGGTSNVAGAVGMAAALKDMEKNDYSDMFQHLYEYFIGKVKEYGGTLNAVPDHKNIVSVMFPKDYWLANPIAYDLALFGVAVSPGSACDNLGEDPKPSRTLLALGLTKSNVDLAFRVSFDRHTKKKDIDALFKALDELREAHTILNLRREVK